MPDYRDMFAGAIPQLMPKPNENLLVQQTAAGLGIPIGVFGGVAANNLVQGAADAAMLPGDAYLGKVDLNSPEGFARTQNLAGMLMGGGMPMAEAGAAGMAGGRLIQGRQYPMAPRSEWYGDANFATTGGRLETMTPDKFLAQSRPMKIDNLTRENIDDLKEHIQSGKALDPLALYKNGKEDGRHRAYAAKELGIETVPVLNWR